MGVRLSYGDDDRVQSIVKSLITVSDPAELLQQIVNHFSPEDLFPESELETWAEDHGWTKPE